MRVIVNCDDFGYSEAVNDAVVNLLERGVATSATVMANGPAFSSAAEYARQNQDRFSFGVHLNLMEFSPCSSASLGPLLAGSGEFAGSHPGCASLKPRLAMGIVEELDAQIRRCREAGWTPTHFDSHYHIHYSPCLIPLLAWLGSKHRIGRIRPTMNRYLASSRPGKVKRGAKWLYNSGLILAGFDRPDVMSDPRPLVERLASGEQSAETWECMLHPGNPRSTYEEEVAVWERGLARHREQIDLVTYAEL